LIVEASQPSNIKPNIKPSVSNTQEGGAKLFGILPSTAYAPSKTETLIQPPSVKLIETGKIADPLTDTLIFTDSKPAVDSPIPKIDVPTRSRSKNKLVLKVDLKSETTQKQESVQEFKSEVIQSTVIKPSDPIPTFKFGSSSDTPPPTFKKRKFKAEFNSGFKTGFNVLVRREGKFRTVSSNPLSFEQAKQLGASVVGRTASATFKLEKVSTSKLGSFEGRGNLSDFYRKGDLFIERRERRIKSSGEKEEITLKGLASLRLGKRNKRGVF